MPIETRKKTDGSEFQISDIKKYECWECGIESHKHKNRNDAEICFVNHVKRRFDSFIQSIDITIDVLNGYSSTEISIKYKVGAAMGKYHVAKILPKIIEKYDIDYDLFWTDYHTNGDEWVKFKTLKEFRLDKKCFLKSLEDEKISLESKRKKAIKGE